MKLEDWPEYVRHLIPPGFDLDAYKDAERYTLSDWLGEAVYRSGLFNPDNLFPKSYFGLRYQYVQREADKKNTKQLRESANSVREMNMVDVGAIFNCLLQDADFLKWNKRRRKVDAVAQEIVEQVDAGDKKKINEIWEVIDHFKLAPSGDTVAIAILAIAEKAISQAPTRFTRDDLFSERHTTWPQHTYLCVDFAAPTDLLVKDFLAWLDKAKQARPELKMKLDGREYSEITPARLQRIADNRVLAYIDLVNWFREHDQPRPPQRMMHQILFPNDERLSRDDSWFRKAVVEPAKWFSSEKALEMLKYQLHLNR